MLEPLMTITGLKTFELIVPRISDTYWDFAVDAPFKVIEKPVDTTLTQKMFDI